MPAGGPPGGGAPNAPPGPPPGQGGLPPTAATQSPPDLASLYLQMENRNRSANEIDHGLAMMASAFAAPGTQGQIMHSADNMNQDPGAQLSNLIQLQNLQRQAANRPNIVAALTGSAPGAGGVDPNLAAAYGGMTNEQLQAALQDKMKSQIAITQQGTEERQKDLLDAQQKAPAALQQMSDMDNVTNQLKGPLNPALTSIISSASARFAAEKLLDNDPKTEPGDAMRQVYASSLSSDQLAAVNQLKKLDAQIYGDAFQSTGSRRTQQEVANLKNGISPLKNFNQTPDAYISQFNDFQNQLHTTIANTYGAAGRVDEIPEFDEVGHEQPERAQAAGSLCLSAKRQQVFWRRRMGEQSAEGPGRRSAAKRRRLPEGQSWAGGAVRR